ncbi:MAG: phospholipid carrier-dependent glycosyltransferase [Thaumarchaeota archaeon]|nr:phospholipid carrier-dependent glycosyltransferase [Nitrososphaerota archaeon]
MNARLEFVNKYRLLIISILIVSVFTHLWNVDGFPDIFFDEGIYMHRAMHVLNGLGPQEGSFYDHPFFGQTFLAVILGFIGYPSSLHSSGDTNSIAILYTIPRIIMGLLAVADTFLIYKIAGKRYGQKVALVSAVLFSVMPISWIFRRILLDSILLPFLLLSIWTALQSKNSKHITGLVLLSGICLGLAVFTKIPAFTTIPLVGGIIFFSNTKRFKLLALWIIPVILIPSLWPVQSIEAGHFNYWMHDVFYFQTHRVGGADLNVISKEFADMDPVLFGLGIAGIGFAVIRRDYLILGWFAPFVVFLYFIGYNQYFYWIPVIPVMCIAAGVLITKSFEKIPKRKISKDGMIVFVLGICAFGMIGLVQLISTDMTSAEYSATSFVVNQSIGNDTTILASPTYTWIFSNVFHKNNVPLDYSQILFEPINTTKVVLVADPHYMVDFNRGRQIVDMYNSTQLVATFDDDISKYFTDHYPYQSLRSTVEGIHIEIREKN